MHVRVEPTFYDQTLKRRSGQRRQRPLSASLGAYDFVSIRSLTQEDPIGLAGGLNLYAFASGDPVNFSDPFGLQTDSDSTKSETQSDTS